MKPKFAASSIGKKVFMAASGIVFMGFIVFHLLSNLTLFDVFGGKDAFNIYSHKIILVKPLVYSVEALLLVAFFVHVINGVRITMENRRARPQGYAVKAGLGKKSWASSNMGITGSFIFIFLIIHLKTFKFGASEHYLIEPYGMVRDLYSTVVQAFASRWQGIPVYATFYILAMLLLGFHLSHGFQSVFRSLGFYHDRYTPGIEKLSLVFALLMTAGFLSMPVYFGFMSGGTY